MYFVGNQWVEINYEVPTYKVRIEGGSDYDAVRFGVVNKGILPPPPVMTCNTGIPHHCICHPTWKPGYNPHTVAAGIRTGAWILFPQKYYYIHEGANRLIGEVGGTIGCIEILDDRWKQFLAEIEGIAAPEIAFKKGIPIQDSNVRREAIDREIGIHGKLTVTIEEAVFPPAKLASPFIATTTVEVRG